MGATVCRMYGRKVSAVHAAAMRLNISKIGSLRDVRNGSWVLLEPVCSISKEFVHTALKCKWVSGIANSFGVTSHAKMSHAQAHMANTRTLLIPAESDSGSEHDFMSICWPFQNCKHRFYVLKQVTLTWHPSQTSLLALMVLIRRSMSRTQGRHPMN